MTQVSDAPSGRSLSPRAKWGLVGLCAAWLGVAYIVARPTTADRPGWAADYASAIAQAARTGRPALLYFSSEDCPNCRQMERVLSEDAVQARVSRFVPVRIDAWHERQLANRFRVYGVPTFVVVDAHGSPLARSVGAESADRFARFLERAAAMSRGAAPGDVATASAGP